jgi:hypothetical protein
LIVFPDFTNSKFCRLLLSCLLPLLCRREEDTFDAGRGAVTVDPGRGAQMSVSGVEKVEPAMDDVSSLLTADVALSTTLCSPAIL